MKIQRSTFIPTHTHTHTRTYGLPQEFACKRTTAAARVVVFCCCCCEFLHAASYFPTQQQLQQKEAKATIQQATNRSYHKRTADYDNI